jgi:uncharacterized protein (DUF2336 family)
MSTSVSAVSSVQSTLATVLQEATETRAVTMQEAARGDRQAVRKLAAEQASQPAPQPARASAPAMPGVGGKVDSLA